MEMNEEYIENTLNKISKVDAPPFLYTRISAQLESVQEVKPKQWVMIGAIACLLLVFNVVMFRSANDTQQLTTTTTNEYGLNPSNQLYYE